MCEANERVSESSKGVKGGERGVWCVCGGGGEGGTSLISTPFCPVIPWSSGYSIPDCHASDSCPVLGIVVGIFYIYIFCVCCFLLIYVFISAAATPE